MKRSCAWETSAVAVMYIVWVYGDDSLSRFNGVAILGDHVSPYHVQEKNGLRYTDFNRTLADALANESILDMQGIEEALSRYYDRNGSSFAGLFPLLSMRMHFQSWRMMRSPIMTVNEAHDMQLSAKKK